MSVLNNKNCFLSGATGGVGEIFAEKLASKGCNLFLTSTSNKSLQTLCDNIQSKYDVEVFFESSDFTNTESVMNVSKVALEKYGSIDVLVNSAGIFEQKPIEDTTNEEFFNTLNTNLYAPYYFSKTFSIGMKEKSWGRIVNMGSSSSYKGIKNSSLYCISKHGLSGLSKVLDEELINYGVRTLEIQPGSINTKMGQLDETQNHSTFIEPESLVEFTLHALEYDNNMKLSEVKIFRTKYE